MQEQLVDGQSLPNDQEEEQQGGQIVKAKERRFWATFQIIHSQIRN